MSDTAAFTSFAPGFEFLQSLVKNAGAALPGVGQWVAPTLNPEELDKRIQELRTVQFWLEQNAKMLGATIQALEVQKMTLTTLQTMNVQMGDLRDALTMRMPTAAAAPTPAQPAPPVQPDASSAAAATADEAEASPAAPQAEAKPAIDPMQWWGALTQQFSELAASALKERAAEASALVASAVPGVPSAKAAPARSNSTQKAASHRGATAAAPAKKRAARKAPARTPR